MRTRPPRSLHALLVVAAALCLAAPAAADHDDSYAYFRIIEGSATLTQAGSGTQAAAEINQPLLAGDRLWVPRSSRLEVVLSDGNLLRVDGDSELLFAGLAGSPESDDRVTVVRLLAGEVQLVVRDRGGDPPRIDTPNATVYAQAEGVYRVETQTDDSSLVVVREGYAEVVTERGSVVVRDDEEAWVQGVRDAYAEVQSASARDGLERWAARLDDEVRGDRYAYLDEDLRYEGSSLSRYGSWVNVDHSWAWRPHVSIGWRPYWQGRWSHTHRGAFWVSYEPWGWVPYHYGTWDYLPSYGWIWYPGRAFAPAWVYWYWGPSYVGWCPVGYYTRWYGHHYPGFRFGTYGWIHGDWGLYGHWNFVSHGHFGRRDLHHWTRSGRDLRDTRPGGPGRGILTTDTRQLTPDDWSDPGRAQEVLERRVAVRRSDGGGLPDVTPFVERRQDLPPEVRTRVVAERPEGPDGSPLRPLTLGRPRDDSGERGDAGQRRVISIQPREPRGDGEAGEGWRVRGRTDSGGPRVVPSRPDRTEPDGDANDEGWRARGRSDDDDGAHAIPSRPSRRDPDPEPPAADRGDQGSNDRSDEGPRVRERDDQGDRGDQGDRESDGPRALPSRPSQRDPDPPSTDGGDQGWRVRGRTDSGAGPRVLPSRPSRPQSDDDGDDAWRDRGRGNSGIRPAPQVDRRPPADRSYRSVTPDRGSSANDTPRPRYQTQPRYAPPPSSAPRPDLRPAPSRPTYSRPEARPAPPRSTYQAPPSAPRHVSPSQPRYSPPSSSPRQISPPSRGSGSSGSSGRSAAPRSRSSERSSPPPERRSRDRGDG